MRDGMVRCPVCFEGKRYPPCRMCDGRGVEEHGRTCARCNGAGELEIDVAGCDVCVGTGEVRRGTARIREAVRYGGDGEKAYRRVEPPDGSPVPFALDPDGRAIFEQDGHGTTQRSLRAYAALRDRIRPAADRMIAVTDYLIPGFETEKRTIATAAIVIRTPDALLVLTGCSWGYGGEGPNGTAAILDDLQAFPTYDDALAFVASKPMNAVWSLSLPARVTS